MNRAIIINISKLEVKCMKSEDMPLGLGMALAQNTEAMKKFSNLSEKEKQIIIEGTHSISSKTEMHRYVNNIADKN